MATTYVGLDAFTLEATVSKFKPIPTNIGLKQSDDDMFILENNPRLPAPPQSGSSQTNNDISSFYWK